MNNTFSRFILLCVFSLLIQQDSIAQGEGNVWYFSSGSGVNFNQACDILDLSSSMNGIEGTVSFSDQDGNLLFYTNGGRNTGNPGLTGKIWNRDHEVMYDMGTTEGGGASARQSSLVVPKPGDPNHYYLFTHDELEAVTPGDFRGLSYFEIDMDMNGGLGEVVDYQETLLLSSDNNEGMAAVKRPDNNSYWLVASGQTGFDFFLIDDNGINLDHTQVLNSFITVAPFTFSPNGEYVSFGSNVMDFDAETGMFSNDYNFTNSGVSPVGSTFSPNSRYFFVGRLYSNSVYRFDMEAADVVGSLTEIATIDPSGIVGQVQVAPDGNIYFLQIDPINAPNQLSISAILCPNSETPCLKESLYTYSFDGNTLAPGLPSFLDHYFMSDVVENGLEVCTDQSGFQICPGEDVTLSVTHYLADTYEWSTGEITSSITVNTPGVYTVTVSDGCCNTTEEIFEILSNASGILDLTLEGEQVICDGEATTLTANSNSAISYEWSTGSTDNAIDVSTSGIYSVTVTDDCNTVLTEEIEVIASENIDLELNLDGNLSCGGQIIASINTNASNIQWSTGQTGNQIIIETSGNYTVEIENECDSELESFTISPETKLFEMPNAFTPDQDGANDIFRPIWGCDDINNFDLKIFNRWGQKVYESSDPLVGWDGTFKGSPATSDVFMYTMSFEVSDDNRIETSGDVTLIR